MNESKKIQPKIESAITLIKLNRPYLGHLIDVSKFMPVHHGLNTIAIDEYCTIYYHPPFLDELSTGQTAAVLVHEYLHVLCNHHQRRKTRDQARWNIATDLSVNSVILHDTQNWVVSTEDQVRLPRNVLLPKIFSLPDLLSPERYYDLLPSALTHHPLDDSSASDGIRRSFEKNHPAQEKQETAVERAIDYSVRDLHSMTESCWCDATKFLLRDIPKKILHHVSWSQSLRSQVQSALFRRKIGRLDYSYARISRRTIVTGGAVITPNMRDLEPKIVFVIDTSGSMDDSQLKTALAATQSAMYALDLQYALVFFCDTLVHKIERIQRTNLNNIHITGDGGTDMSVGILTAYNHHTKPSVIVVFTDGMTPWEKCMRPFYGTTIIVGIIDPHNSLGIERIMQKVPKNFTAVAITGG